MSSVSSYFGFGNQTQVAVAEDARTAVNNSTGSLLNRWAAKVIPMAAPELKMPLNMLKTANTLEDAYTCYQNGDSLGVAKKVAPLAAGGLLMAVGGSVASTVFGISKAYGFLNLISSTVSAIAEFDKEYAAEEQENQWYQEGMDIYGD